MMKNQLIYTIFAAGTVLGLASCNNDVVSSLLHDENDRISFTAATDNDVTATTRGLTEMSQGVSFRDTQAGRPLMLSATVTGRAQTTTRGHRFGDEAEDELTAFRVSAIQADANISGEDFAEATPNLFYNLKAQKNAGDVFEIAQDYYWPISSDKLWFYAYTPCDDNNVVVSSQTTGGAQKITFTVDPVVTNQVDLMTADAVTTGFNDVSGTQKKASVPLTFRHELTAIRFVIGEQWLAGSIKSVAIKGVHGKGTLTIGDGSHWVWKDATGTDISTLDDFTLTLDKTGVEGISGEEFMDGDFSKQYFLMIPQSFDDNDDACIEVKYQDLAQEYTVTAPLKGQDAWQRNTTVTYAISSHTLTTLKIGTIAWPVTNETQTWAGPKTDFVAGDEVGLYVVNPDGTTIPDNRRNIRCSYDGAAWTIHHPVDAPIYKLPGYQYFFYYPYTPTPDTKYPVQGQGTTDTQATAFFSHLIEGWIPAANQNTIEKLNAQDLQVARGVDHLTQSSTINGQMTHQMNIGVITLGTKSVPNDITYELSTDANYTWYDGTDGTSTNIGASSEFDTNIPCSANDKYYYVFKPVKDMVSDPGTLLKGLRNGSADWTYYLQSTDNGIADTKTVTTALTTYPVTKTYTMAIGDVLYSDGALSRNTATALNTYSDRTAIALIFATATSNTDRNTYGFKHGYAMGFRMTSASFYNSKEVPTSFGTKINTEALFKNYKDGYTVSKAIRDYAISNGGFDKWPAVQWCMNFQPLSKDGNSTIMMSIPSSYAWFMPSCGQMYDIWANLGDLGGEYEVRSNDSRVTSIAWYGSIGTGAHPFYTIYSKLANLRNAGYSAISISEVNTIWCASFGDTPYAIEAYSSSEEHPYSDIYLWHDNTTVFHVLPVIAF